MNAERLVNLVSQRKTVLDELLEISQRQVTAVQQGRMNELMSLLAEKQAPLAKLREYSACLAEAAPDDPATRVWDRPEQRAQCQAEHARCEEMLRTLMEMEAQCEQTLSQSRESLQKQLEQTQTAQQAVTGYAEAEQANTSGGRLDLSSQ
tara:strand:- start:27844 stop:28293 length:450 start_codon:yes stop_codon:yes gene_type:complete